MHARAGLGLIILAVLALDQSAKILVSSTMVVGESIPIVPNLLHLTLVHNSGMAFGLLSAAAIPYKSVLMTLLSIAAFGAVAAYAVGSPASERMSRLALAFILGGAVGNIIDRVRLGYVVDFIDVFYKGSHWPAFNVADSAICAGVGLLLLDTLRRPVKSTATPGAGDS